MYCLHILLKKAALSLDDGLHPASEGHTALGHRGLVHGGKVLLNGDDQGGLGSVGTSVSMCLQVAPHKIVQRIKIRTAGRPAVLRNQAVAVVLVPLEDLLETWQGTASCSHTQGRSPATVLIKGRTVISMTSKLMSVLTQRPVSKM
jgi:hypothetical protein